MKNQGYKWGLFFCKLFRKADRLEKPLPTDEQKKERGNLTCRVMLRQLNCLYERNNVTMSVKQLEHWFETGQHLKEWKEWDTI